MPNKFDNLEEMQNKLPERTPTKIEFTETESETHYL